jgi:hypothetical protein
MKVNGLHERMGMALLDATFGYQIRSGRYQKENEVSDVIASRDLKKLCDLGLLTAVGEKRGRFYQPAKTLTTIYARVREDNKAPDPYELIHQRAPKAQMRLPGVV